jgi:hypothetical protein
MGNQPAGYWICVLLAIAALVASYFMRSSADAHVRQISNYLLYGAVALVLIGRFGFKRKPDPTPPMPRD